MSVVNGSNGGAFGGHRGRILDSVRCHRFPYSRLPLTLRWHVPRPSRRPAGRKGQAIVETALLLPIVMFLVMGSSDLGRAFYYSIETTNAAREGARQGTYFDPRTQSNVYDTYPAVFNAVKAEAPDLALSVPAATRCLAGAPSSWGAYYPTTANTGYVYICFDQNDTQATPAQDTVNVMILYNFQPVTPIADLVGSSYVRVVSNITMQVQQRP